MRGVKPRASRASMSAEAAMSTRASASLPRTTANSRAVEPCGSSASTSAEALSKLWATPSSQRCAANSSAVWSRASRCDVSALASKSACTKPWSPRSIATKSAVEPCSSRCSVSADAPNRSLTKAWSPHSAATKSAVEPCVSRCSVSTEAPSKSLNKASSPRPAATCSAARPSGPVRSTRGRRCAMAGASFGGPPSEGSGRAQRPVFFGSAGGGPKLDCCQDRSTAEHPSIFPPSTASNQASSNRCSAAATNAPDKAHLAACASGESSVDQHRTGSGEPLSLLVAATAPAAAPIAPRGA
mmetsp:Transcript_159153/g.510477  ORF Transcript_159153/g.510477 Transcript_159153/m.510477 type:complete len:299 (+) Transcript_159153:1258-2154(+)